MTKLKYLIKRKFPNLFFFLKKLRSLQFKIIIYTNKTYIHDQGINVGIKKFEETEKLVFDKINNAENSHKLNFLNCGSALGQINFFTNDINTASGKSQIDLFFSRYNYFTLDLMNLDLNSIQKKSTEVYFSDIQKKKKVNKNIFLNYPNDFHAGHIVHNMSEIFKNDEYKNKFDFIYTEDVIEHVPNPFIFSSNLLSMLKEGGVIVCMCPFSYPYHKDPEDYFRFTHKGLEMLFNSNEKYNIKLLKNGYDVDHRRENRNDDLSRDTFGGWRENWWTFIAIQKISNTHS